MKSVCAAIALTVLPLFAAPVPLDEAETRTTFSSGTVSEFGPDAIVIRSESGRVPMRYSYSRTTTYVDETGALRQASVPWMLTI